MFKRIDRKRKKLEEEEELGLDEDIKAIMGLNDTDSEESASESDSSSDGDLDAEQSGEEDLEEARDESEDEGEGVEAIEDDEPPISLSEALRDPVYVVSLDPDVRACILCKGKVIKGTPMSQVHKTSTAHKRRFERFKTLSEKSDQDSDAWQIARIVQNEGSTQNHPDTESGMSKRALKRAAKQASVREKRMLHKKLRAKAKAKQASAKEALESQDAEVKEAVASKPLGKAKSRKTGAKVEAKETVKKKQRKIAGSKLHAAAQSNASPQRAPEPQTKKRKIQRNDIEISATPQAPLQSPGKPLGKAKVPREKRRNKSEGTRVAR